MIQWHECALCGYPIELARTEHDVCKQEVQRLYESRRDRLSHPEGHFDKVRRWEPSPFECCDCCTVRSPSRAYPYSLLVHCRTLKHVRNLYRKQMQLARTADAPLTI